MANVLTIPAKTQFLSARLAFLTPQTNRQNVSSVCLEEPSLTDFANAKSDHSKESSQMEPGNVSHADLDANTVLPPLPALRVL